ncbi:MAG: T9SS type A sorting domain-containing protein [Bacteroidetes bacterium]|jgi:hypothetical protein|nr:T9SS type A sorting domain-containing protein [Bacteroidota bacterium]
MKKFFTAVLLSAGALFANGQNLNYTNLTSDVYGSIEDSVIQATVLVANVGTHTIDASLKVYNTNLYPLAEHSFCWGILCNGVGTMVSPVTSTINAGASDNTFRGDYFGHGYIGSSTIAYTVFDNNNPNDSVQFMVHYHITPVGINQPAQSNLLSKLYPNPAKSMTALNYQLNKGVKAEIKIINMLGKTINTIPVSDTNGNVVLSTTNYPNGIYMVALAVDGKNVSVQRLVVNR